MMKNLTVALLIICCCLLLVRQQSEVRAAPDVQQSTPTPAMSEEPVAGEPDEEATDEASAEPAAEPTLQDLLARVDALQAQVDALAAQVAAADAAANEVTTAVYLLDTADLHDLDVRLNEGGAIEAADAGNVARVARLLATVDWPADLATEAITLTQVLHDLNAALADDDLARAAPLATQAHDVQHTLSHAAEHWLAEAPAPNAAMDAPGQAFRVTSAVYLLDTAGLHDIDVRLNEEGVIEPGDAGTVTRLARLLATVDWPADLATEAITLTQVLHDLGPALTDDDLARAAPLATQAHDVQHDLSHAAEHWLGEATGTQGADATSAHDEAESGQDHDHGDHDLEDGEETPADKSDEDADHSGG